MSSHETSETKTKVLPATSKLAVMSYLDELLHVATTSAEVEQDDEPEVVEVPPAEPVVETETLRAEPQPVETETEPEPRVQAETYIAPEPITKIQQAQEPPSVWMDNGRPFWAQERFDCLVFSVNGLKLAVPLLLLGNIHLLDKELTPLFDQPAWFLGLQPIHQERNIRVVDTAQLVMPERYDPDAVAGLKYAVGVHDTDWAFGAHIIDGSISLEPEDVKWRSIRTSRPWLAGTVISEMCALVDLDAFQKILVA